MDPMEINSKHKHRVFVDQTALCQFDSTEWKQLTVHVSAPLHIHSSIKTWYIYYIESGAVWIEHFLSSSIVVL